MKVIIQIPCWNEEESLPATLAALPRELEGVAPADLMRRVTRHADYRGWMEDFLT